MQSSWVAPAEIIAFTALVVTFLGFLVSITHNRLASWKAFEARTTKLEIAFEQYQKDTSEYRVQTHQDVLEFLDATKLLIVNYQTTTKELVASYLTTFEQTKAEVRAHHEESLKHVTPDLRAQIANLDKKLDKIISHLLKVNEE